MIEIIERCGFDSYEIDFTGLTAPLKPNPNLFNLKD
jgi:hypothetical protein